MAAVQRVNLAPWSRPSVSSAMNSPILYAKDGYARAAAIAVLGVDYDAALNWLAFLTSHWWNV